MRLLSGLQSCDVCCSDASCPFAGEGRAGFALAGRGVVLVNIWGFFGVPFVGYICLWVDEELILVFVGRVIEGTLRGIDPSPVTDKF